jgi:hypothetical protein
MMDFFDDWDIFIKDNIDCILAGEYDDKFSREQLDKMTELSFLYNHLVFEDNKLTFEYSKYQINLTNLYEQYSDLVYQIGKEGVKNMIINTIISQDLFKSAFKSFLRDRKISIVIE